MLLDALTNLGARNSDESLQQLADKDELSLDAACISLASLTREISSSIGFFEGRREETISKVYVSGGVARSKALLDILAAELQMPCESWNPFQTCEIAVTSARKKLLAEEFV